MKTLLLTLLFTMATPLLAHEKRLGVTCQKEILESIHRLERIVSLYEDGELSHEGFIALIDMSDRYVTRQIVNCVKDAPGVESHPLLHSRGLDSRESIKRLARQYEDTREELLHGTERVD